MGRLLEVRKDQEMAFECYTKDKLDQSLWNWVEGFSNTAGSEIYDTKEGNLRREEFILAGVQKKRNGM